MDALSRGVKMKHFIQTTCFRAITLGIRIRCSPSLQKHWQRLQRLLDSLKRDYAGKPQPPIKSERRNPSSYAMAGTLSNPEVFNYGVETHEAYKQRSLASDITDEQKKVREADLVIFQFPLYWFSVPAILKGWMDRVLCQGFAFDIPGFYDSGLLQGKLALLSVTTGGTAEMYTKTGVNGDSRYFLWPLQHGTLHFCGFKVLAPQISFAPEIASEEERKGMVAAWSQRLQTIWKEEPIPCTTHWHFGQ
ncbi:ribosyldihydronicotinamide dehydrogenase [quinone] isoform X5 [Gorilla gorilla gorilla]|uniref:ribosyldihydronicotinamide dehydrogenase [quinone] isoform X5 n=1 Tax=Gorilla gorilla gorilla TaxID=9595 RepID=UPI00244645E6|nr:ribosyldihydronicotinamide dehydrogenase [quinone] isoform X5 [Gorilla gorilla gorilla]